MKIFDMHTHLGYSPQSAPVLTRMENAGIYGGCIFSPPPIEHNPVNGKPFEVRLNDVLAFTEGHRDRLFPILWIHPYEENIFEKIDIAAQQGIDGFKIICSSFYVYEEKSLAVLSHIAAYKKPVFFHTGILWDKKVSSVYNRPVFWEALMPIKGLRFSLGHCAWPWIDECIALYGQFMNAASAGDTAEMFLDTTPGTPDIYREELLTKLFTIGYDIENNIFFGTDCNAEAYNSDWAAKWLKTDRQIMDKLGVCQAVREKMYAKNLMRFLGKTDTAVEHLSPTTDNANAWSPVSDAPRKTIEKWYKKLHFPSVFDAEFFAALEQLPVSDAICIDTYTAKAQDGKRNLLSYLYFCEALKENYAEKGIREEILLDTLRDIVYWTEIWSDLKNTLYLGETEWLRRHLSMRLFKLGRLQFCMGEAQTAIPSYHVAKGDKVIEIHIPAAGALTKEACLESIELAKAFFAKHFPDFAYTCFTCHSWLLDPSLKDLLDENSNILQFQNLFTVVETEKSDAIFKYIFRWNTTRSTLRYALCTSALAEQVKKRALAGEVFCEALGVLEV